MFEFLNRMFKQFFIYKSPQKYIFVTSYFTSWCFKCCIIIVRFGSNMVLKITYFLYRYTLILSCAHAKKNIRRSQFYWSQWPIAKNMKCTDEKNIHARGMKPCMHHCSVFSEHGIQKAVRLNASLNVAVWLGFPWAKIIKTISASPSGGRFVYLNLVSLWEHFCRWSMNPVSEIVLAAEVNMSRSVEFRQSTKRVRISSRRGPAGCALWF